MNELKTAIANDVKRRLIDVARSRAALKRTGPEELKAKLEAQFKDKLTAMSEWAAELKKRQEEFSEEYFRFEKAVAKAAHGTGFEARTRHEFDEDGKEIYRITVYPGCQSVGADVKRELKLLGKELGLEALLESAE